MTTSKDTSAREKLADEKWHEYYMSRDGVPGVTLVWSDAYKAGYQSALDSHEVMAMYRALEDMTNAALGDIKPLESQVFESLREFDRARKEAK